MIEGSMIEGKLRFQFSFVVLVLIFLGAVSSCSSKPKEVYYVRPVEVRGKAPVAYNPYYYNYRPNSRVYQNPYEVQQPKSRNQYQQPYPYYDSDQYYVPPKNYQNVEPEQRYAPDAKY